MIYGGDIDALGAQLATLFKPRRSPPCDELVEQNVVLSQQFTNRPGKIDLSFTPYLRPLHQWFGDDDVRSITAPKGAQIGFTTFLGNAMGYGICEKPGPGLFITSTAQIAQDWVEREWLPRIKLCEPLTAMVPQERDALKKLSQRFLSCPMNFAGAQSENQLASRPVRYLYCDEAEKWPEGFVEQAMVRTSSYAGMDKHIIGSTLDDELGPTWRHWLKSTQHMWHVACPNCQHVCVIDFFKHIKFSSQHCDLIGKWDVPAAASSAYGQCEACEATWSSSQIRLMILRGEAIATNASADPRHKGLHIPTLLSPYKNIHDLVSLWLTMKDATASRKEFYNLYLALPWSHAEAHVSEEKVLACRALGENAYQLGTCPVVPVDLTLSADVGERMTHWSVEATGADGASYVVDYGTVLAVEDLLTIMEREYPIVGSEKKARIMIGVVDSGYATERVYRCCSNSRGRLWPTKGSGAEFGKPVDVSTIPTWRQLLLYTYVDFFHKTGLYIDAISRRMAPHWWMPSNVGHEFIEGHCGQELKSKQTASRSIKFFKPVANDHFGDCTKGHRVIREVRRQYYAMGLT